MRNSLFISIVESLFAVFGVFNFVDNMKTVLVKKRSDRV